MGSSHGYTLHHRWLPWPAEVGRGGVCAWVSHLRLLWESLRAGGLRRLRKRAENRAQNAAVTSENCEDARCAGHRAESGGKIPARLAGEKYGKAQCAMGGHRRNMLARPLRQYPVGGYQQRVRLPHRGDHARLCPIDKILLGADSATARVIWRFWRANPQCHP